MPHSHLDIGYTHPQPLLLELQVNYINQAIVRCNQTSGYPLESRFCWTIEATHVLKKWLKTAEPENIDHLKKLIREKRICVAALPLHTTPNCNVNQMVQMLSDLEELRKFLGAEMKTAINHDVNGQPWTLGQVMLDSGIDFYLTGINIHFGGIPFQRPAAFQWEMADGRKLTSFLGEHYSLFSQFLFTQEHSVEKMAEGAAAYARRLEKAGYTREFAILTATNPPLFDNNCPDAELSDLIRTYNEKGYEPKIRMVTADRLRERILEEEAQLPVHRGDWTDYWNFGSASTAKETRVSRMAKQTLAKAEVIESFTGKRDVQYLNAKKECYENALVFDEHTWGASQSVTHPDCPETASQLVHKIKTAYEAADLSGYLLSTVMEEMCCNPYQSNDMEGVAIVNTSDCEQSIEVKYPRSYRQKIRQLSALRTKEYVPYLVSREEQESGGIVTVKPFSYQVLSFEDLEQREKEKKSQKCFIVEDTEAITPYYKITFDKITGAIVQVLDKKTNRKILSHTSGFALFEPVRETMDEEKNPPLRATLFPRDVELGNRSITQWNHDWNGKREIPHRLGLHIEETCHQLTFVVEMELSGMKQMEQRITFYSYKSGIHMEVNFLKLPVYEPESLYFAIPARLSGDWKCVYDTAGQMVRLDEEQIGTVCRDWITVDTQVSMYDKDICFCLACPDAPLIQAGGFHFGQENRQIERRESPLLLAWALNNYWDTNFCANQSGAMTFSYDLEIFESFDEKIALQHGITAKSPCVIGAAVKAKKSEKIWMQCDGKASILHVYPSKIVDSINIILTNTESREETYSISFPEFVPKGAEVINVQETLVEVLTAKDHTITFNIPAHRLKIIRVTWGDTAGGEAE